MMFFRLFSNCIIVKGYKQSIIHDLHKSEIIALDNDLTDFLIQSNNNSLEYIATKYDLNLNLNQMPAYYSKFIELGIGFYTDEPNAFPPLSMEWNYPSVISNVILANTLFLTENVIKQCNQINLKNILIIIDNFSVDTIDSFRLMDGGCISSCELIFLRKPNLDKLTSLLESKRIVAVSIYNSDSPTVSFHNEVSIEYFTSNFSHNTDISKLKFICNIPLFTESQQHNTYFNRKLAIDEKGYIKNSPELEWHYGHIDSVKLKDAINDKGNSSDFFKKYAKYKEAKAKGEQYELDFERHKPAYNALYEIHKEKIDVCKECEFRHMCVDACVPLQREDNSWYRSEECNYNPYICKWAGEDGYLPLAECGVECNLSGFHIDHTKIASINECLWKEDE